MQLGNLRAEAAENGSTVRSPNQDPVIGQNFLSFLRRGFYVNSLADHFSIPVLNATQNIRAQLCLLKF